MNDPDMTQTATIELRDLVIAAAIGEYGPEDTVPDVHLLDMTLTIGADLVLIDADTMANVFDYDPLIAEIDRIARDGHYITQEYLMTRIIRACATYPQIAALDLCLRKGPVLGQTGSLGVRLRVAQDGMAALRKGL